MDFLRLNCNSPKHLQSAVHILDLPNLHNHLSQFLKTSLCTSNWFLSISTAPLTPLRSLQNTDSMTLSFLGALASSQAFLSQTSPPTTVSPRFQSWVRLRNYTLCSCTRVSSSRLVKTKQQRTWARCVWSPASAELSVLAGDSFPGPPILTSLRYP